jgi:hypothetical protein
MKLTMKSLPPAVAEGNERPSAFCERVRQQMITELKKLDSNTVWETL